MTRCELLLGRRLLEGPNGEAGQALARAAALFDQVEVAHLAETARSLSATQRMIPG